MTRRVQRLYEAMVADEGLIPMPFGFTINGTTTPDGLIGDELISVAYSEAGEFLCTLRDKPAVCFCGIASVSNTADDVDIYAKVDWSSVTTDGTFTVRTMTGSTQTDPTDNTLVGGVLFVKTTTRAARRG